MNPASQATVNSCIALNISGSTGYLVAFAAVVSLSLAVSAFMQSWVWVLRSGGVLVLFGVLLSFRRLLRLVPQGFGESTSACVFGGKQLYAKAILQNIQRAGDSLAQVSSVASMTLGTLLISFSDRMLDWAFPLIAK